MAAAPMPLPPPPAGAGSAVPQAPTSPIAASPAPPETSPQLEQASRIVINTVRGLRAIAQDFPATAPDISKINDLLRSVQLKMLQNSQPGTAAAPPVNG